MPGLFEYGLSKRAIQILGIMAGALGMLLIGLRDDRVELPPAVKFGGQLIVALVVAAAGIRITLFVPSLIFSYGITALWILTVVNAFNFMDNMNGLCAGLGVIGAGWFGLIAAGQGQYLVAAMALPGRGRRCSVFCRIIFPRATAFLGDAGSHLTGFLLAVLAILPHFYTAKHRHPLAVLTPLAGVGRAAGRHGLGGAVALESRQTVLHRRHQPSFAPLGAAGLDSGARRPVHLAALRNCRRPCVSVAVIEKPINHRHGPW